jgi:hypothetical protein
MIVLILIACLYLMIQFSQHSLLKKFNHCSRLNLDEKQKLICTKKITFTHGLTLLLGSIIFYFSLLFSPQNYISNLLVDPQTKTWVTGLAMMALLVAFRWLVLYKKDSLFYPVFSLVMVIIILAGLKDIIQPELVKQFGYYYYCFSQTIIFIAFAIAMIFSSIYFFKRQAIIHLLRSYLFASLSNILAFALTQYLAHYLYSSLYFITCLALSIYLPMWLSLVNLCQIFNEYDSFDSDLTVQEIQT